MTIQNQIARPTLILFFLIALGAGLMFLMPGEAESGGLGGPGQEGHWGYVTTAYSASNDTCGLDSDCKEWCFTGPDGVQPTGILCCVDQNDTCLGR